MTLDHTVHNRLKEFSVETKYMKLVYTHELNTETYQDYWVAGRAKFSWGVFY